MQFFNKNNFIVGALPLLFSEQIQFNFDPNGDNLALIGSNDTWLYIREEKIRTSFKESDVFQIGRQSLVSLNSTWGVCEEILFFTKLPRRCRRQEVRKIHCELGTSCPSIDWILNTYEYSDYNKLLTIYKDRESTESEILFDIGGIIICLLFLAIWVTLMDGLTTIALSRTTNISPMTDDLKTMWDETKGFFVPIGDVIFLAGSIKLLSYFDESPNLSPLQIDFLLGHDFANWYSHFYIMMTLLITLISLAILLWMPKDIKNFKTALITLLYLRWTTEFLILAAIHISVPISFGHNVGAFFSLAIGIGIGIFSGRDFHLILKWQKNKKFIFMYVLLYAFIIFHVFLYMVYSAIVIIPTITPTVAIFTSVLIALFSFYIGATAVEFYNREKYHDEQLSKNL